MFIQIEETKNNPRQSTQHLDNVHLNKRETDRRVSEIFNLKLDHLIYLGNYPE